MEIQKNNQEAGLQIWQDQFLALSPKKGIDIVNSPNKSLSFMMVEHGEIKVKALLTVLISDTLDFFSISNSMSDRQIAQTVNLILEDYPLLLHFFDW